MVRDLEYVAKLGTPMPAILIEDAYRIAGSWKVKQVTKWSPPSIPPTYLDCQRVIVYEKEK